MLRSIVCTVAVALLATTFSNGPANAADPNVEKVDPESLKHPLAADARQKLTESLQAQVESLTKAAKENPEAIGNYSRRGDAYFYLGRFDKAVQDYEEMVEIDPRQDASHWRRGIARFYAGKFKEAAHQFEIYNTFDDVDRENGIWRYFSQYKAYGPKRARDGLLKYKKDDREPFPSVYRLFSGELTGSKILESIKLADIDENEREKRYFYAYLYIGLNDALEGRKASALKHLKASTGNRWGPRAGFGPHYMWQVGRLHYELLVEEQSKGKSKKDKPAKKKQQLQPKPASGSTSR